MNNFFPTIYAPVKVSERLPEKFGMYRCIVEIYEDGLRYTPTTYAQYDTISKEWTNPSICGKSCKVIEWLEPLTNRYVFTEDELKEEKKKNSCEFIEWLESQKWGSGVTGFESIYDEFLNSKNKT